MSKDKLSLTLKNLFYIFTFIGIAADISGVVAKLYSADKDFKIKKYLSD